MNLSAGPLSHTGCLRKTVFFSRNFDDLSLTSTRRAAIGRSGNGQPIVLTVQSHLRLPMLRDMGCSELGKTQISLNTLYIKDGVCINKTAFIPT